MVFDLVAGDTQERSWSVLKKGGAFISTLAEPSQDEARARGVRAESYVAQPDAQELDEIGRLIDDGKLMPHVDAVYAFGDVAAAYRQLEDGHVRGKVVVDVGTA